MYLKPRFSAQFTRSAAVVAAIAAVAMPATAQLQLEEVIVTAQKREQTLQDVPSSVAAVTREALEKTVSNNFSDLNKITSGLTITGDSDGFGKVIRIRGVGTNSFVPAIRPAVGIFLNEVPLSAPEMAYNNLADIERIEILKGPQATLFGKEVSSGAISMHTARPNTEEVKGYLESNLGNLGLLEVRGATNLPISDQWALRVMGYYNERDDIIDNTAVPDRPGGAYEQSGYRAQLLWEPTDTLSVMLGYEDHETEFYGSVSVTREYGDLNLAVDEMENPGNSRLVLHDPADRKMANSDPSDRDTDIAMWTLHVSWDINERWSFTSITSDQEFEQLTSGDQNPEGTSDTSVSPYRLNDFITAPGTDSFSQELRLSYDSGDWSSIIGAFYADTDTVSYTPFSQAIGLLGGTLHKAAGLSDITDDFEEWAIFTHNIYSISDGLDLSFGARYSYVEKEAQKGQVTGVGPLAVLNSPIVPTSSWADAIPVQKDDWDEITGTLKLTYWLNESVSLYGGWDRGFKAGGQNVCKDTASFDPACPEPFDSETADNFEIGMKGRFFDRTLSLNLAGFFQTYDNYQVEVQDEFGLGNSVQTAASVEIKGIESEFVWLATENLSIDGTVSWIDASWDEYEDAGCIRDQYQREACAPVEDANGNVAWIQDLSGADLNYTPEWSYNFNATWSDIFTNGMEWYLRGEVAYRDDVYFFPDLDPDLVDDDYTLLNASLGITGAEGDWDVVVWGKNLADEDYLSGGAKNNDASSIRLNPQAAEGYRVTAGEERTYGVTLRYRF